MDTLQAGQNLAVGQRLESGGYALTLQDDGNLVLSDGADAVWSTGTQGSGATSANLQDDGNFILYTASGNLVWESGTGGNPGARLTVQSDRNAVIYNSGGTAVWQSHTVKESAPAAGAPAAPAEQRYTVEPGDSLSAIAERFYGDANQYQRIADANGIDNPDLIHPGQELTIPA